MFKTFKICSSTSLVDILTLKKADVVKYLSCLESAAHIIFLKSNIYKVSSGAVSALYYYDPMEVSGENPTMKKWRLRNGINLAVSSLKSEFNWPGNIRQQVTQDIAAKTKCLRSLYVGVVNLRVL